MGAIERAAKCSIPKGPQLRGIVRRRTEFLIDEAVLTWRPTRGSGGAALAMLEDRAGRVYAALHAVLTSAEFNTNRPGMFNCYDCGRLVDPANLATVVSHGILYGDYLGVKGADVLDVGRSVPELICDGMGIGLEPPDRTPGPGAPV